MHVALMIAGAVGVVFSGLFLILNMASLARNIFKEEEDMTSTPRGFGRHFIGMALLFVSSVVLVIGVAMYAATKIG